MNNIKSERVRKGLSQAEAVKLLKLSPQCLSSYELAKRDIPSGTLIAMHVLYGCSVDYLLGVSPTR